MATVWVSAIKKLILIKSKNGHYVTLLCFNFGFVDNARGYLVFLLVIIMINNLAHNFTIINTFSIYQILSTLLL